MQNPMRGKRKLFRTCCRVRRISLDSHPGSVHPCIQLVAASIHKKIPNLIVFLCFPKLFLAHNEQRIFRFRSSPFNVQLLYFFLHFYEHNGNTTKKYILISFKRTQALFSSLSLDILLAPSHTYSQYIFFI